MREEFKKQLEETGYLHKSLPACYERSKEAGLLRKKVIQRRRLWDGTSLNDWIMTGQGEIAVPVEGILRMTAPARSDKWPDNESPDGDYAAFGYQSATLRIADGDWKDFNRVVCRIKPLCEGFHKPLIRMDLRNDGTEKIPDVYNREGFHDINLKNFTWNDCVWEFPDMPRDKVTDFSFTVSCHGKEISGDDFFIFDICDIYLEKVEKPDHSYGWQGNSDTICFSTTGYWTEGNKTAIINIIAASREGVKEIGTSSPQKQPDDNVFYLLEEPGDRVVFTGHVQSVNNEKGSFGVLDFTEFREEGRYRIKFDDIITYDFAINSQAMEEALWKAINFLYSERCGYPVGGGHGTCHTDITASHNGLSLVYCGGWHDAGDLSQQTLQTAEITAALFETASAVKNDIPLYRRIIEEAVWGLDFVLRTRFGDGYRATSVGIRRWTNGLMGDMDDEKARVHNRSFDNFLMAGVEAYAGYAIKNEDTELARKAINAAREDYGFAAERFKEVGTESCIMFEHTYNASISQYYAVAAWSAAWLYKVTGDGYYAKEAEHFADLMLSCREAGEAGLPFKGFFYRDETKKTIVHFNHQAREHLFMQTLRDLCHICKNSPKRSCWENAMKEYGEYLKAIYTYAEPFGMLPAGIHSLDEAEDGEVFPFLHLMTDYESDKHNYAEQLKNGIPLGDKHCIKHFPVWFSFRGNTAVHLSSGKAASLIGKYFNDPELTEIAREQLYWVAGKNPFGQSLMYGEGSNYAQQYAALAGEMTGELPVGIQTRGNEDIPYWPMANNATYKEVWTSSAGHWLRVVADLYAGDL